MGFLRLQTDEGFAVAMAHEKGRFSRALFAALERNIDVVMRETERASVALMFGPQPPPADDSGYYTIWPVQA
jgi:hypothetical protein